MAIEFNGTSQRLSCGSGASIDDIASLSIGAWMYLDDVTGYQVIASKYAGWIIRTNANKLELYRNWTGGAGLWISTNVVFVATTWAHFLITYNNSSTANNPIFYINGVSVAVTKTQTPVTAPTSDAASTLWWGSYGAGADWFDGKLQDCRIANVIWTPEQIAWLASGSRTSQPLGNEVCWLDFELARGAWTGALTQGSHIFNDLSGNGNDADPYGSPVLVASECPRLGVLT